MTTSSSFIPLLQEQPCKCCVKKHRKSYCLCVSHRNLLYVVPTGEQIVDLQTIQPLFQLQLYGQNSTDKSKYYSRWIDRCNICMKHSFPSASDSWIFRPVPNPKFWDKNWKFQQKNWNNMTVANTMAIYGYLYQAQLLHFCCTQKAAQKICEWTVQPANVPSLL